MTIKRHAVLNMRLPLARPPEHSLIMVSGGDPPAGSVAMSQKLAKRFMIAFGLGLVLAMIFDHSALGFALGFAVVFGGGLVTE
jgi:hypothetical protein